MPAVSRQRGPELPEWGAVAFADGGRSLVFVLDDGNGTLWPISLDEWKTHACLVAGGNLTSEEWHRLITQEQYAAICPQLPRP